MALKAHLLWHALKDGSVPLAYPAGGAELDKARARQRSLAPADKKNETPNG